MVKKIIIGITVLGVCLLAGFKLFSSFSKENKKLNDIQENLTSYHMECKMEINDNDENKNYFIVVDYLKKEEKDNFRVSLLDRDINQEQILLKNDDGVFVLTPLLNQVYKFKGDYPLNSPKPYLYHSMLNALKQKHELKTLKDGYLLSYNPNYESQKNWVKEDIKLSSDYKPVWINIYNGNQALVATLIFSNVEFNKTYDDNFFNVEENMKKARENLVDSSSKLEDLPLIPTSSIENAELEEKIEVKNNDESMFILTYKGNKSYRVIQYLLKPNEELNINEYPGTMVDTFYGISYYKNNYLTYITGNVYCEIYSLDLEVNEMVNVVSSMELTYAK